MYILIYSGGGAEHQVLYLANYLQRRHDVAIVTLSLGDNLPDFCKHLDFILPKKSISPPIRNQRIHAYYYNVNAILKMRSMVKSQIEKYELLNPHNFPAPFSCMKHSKKKVVWYSQGDSPGFYGNTLEIRRNLFSHALNECLLYTEKLAVRKYIDKICTVSKLAARIIEKRYRKPIPIVYPGIDYEFYSQGNAQEAVNKYELDGSFVVLQVARVTLQKNQMAAVTALEKLVKTIPNIKLVIAGRGESSYLRDLKNYIKLKSLERYVTFAGPATDEDIRGLYHACDVNILPTRLESFGLTAIEGLCACKIPIVSSQCGVGDFLLEYNIGKVSDDLVSSIIEIYENPEIYKTMATTGKKVVKEQLSRDAFGKRFENIFLSYEKK